MHRYTGSPRILICNSEVKALFFNRPCRRSQTQHLNYSWPGSDFVNIYIMHRLCTMTFYRSGLMCHSTDSRENFWPSLGFDSPNRLLPFCLVVTFSKCLLWNLYMQPSGQLQWLPFGHAGILAKDIALLVSVILLSKHTRNAHLPGSKLSNLSLVNVTKPWLRRFVEVLTTTN